MGEAIVAVVVTKSPSQTEQESAIGDRIIKRLREKVAGYKVRL